MRFVTATDHTADRPWGALDLATVDGASVRLHWTDEPYVWHVNDGVEVFVVLDGAVIEKGAEVRTAIVDVDVAVRRDARVGAAPAATKVRDADIAVIGAGATVRGVVKPGEQIDPGDVVG